MSKLIDLTGMKFNRLTVVSRAENAKGGITRWNCICECGNTVVVRGHNLKNGSVKSCGCYKPKRGKHQMTGTRLYRIWRAMRSRCYLETNPRYKDYGGRGICVFSEWNNDFQSFYNWSISNGYGENLTIDRIDNDGNYEPSNCRWISYSEQDNNKRSCLKLTYNGKTQNLRQWCDELGLDYKRMHNRIHKNGWSVERAFTTPCNVNKRNKKARKKEYG